MTIDDQIALAAIADTMRRHNLSTPQDVTYVPRRPTVITIRLTDFARWVRALDPTHPDARIFTTEDGVRHWYVVGTLTDTDTEVRLVATEHAAAVLSVSA